MRERARAQDTDYAGHPEIGDREPARPEALRHFDKLNVNKDNAKAKQNSDESAAEYRLNPQKAVKKQDEQLMNLFCLCVYCVVSAGTLAQMSHISIRDGLDFVCNWCVHDSLRDGHQNMDTPGPQRGGSRIESQISFGDPTLCLTLHTMNSAEWPKVRFHLATPLL